MFYHIYGFQSPLVFRSKKNFHNPIITLNRVKFSLYNNNDNNKRSHDYELFRKFAYNSEVIDALKSNKPIVALESTIISHGW